MRLAFISTMDGSPWGGSEELWSQAAVRLKQCGHDVWASVCHWPQLSEKIVALAKHGVRLQTHPTRHDGGARRAWNRLSRSCLRGYSRLKRFDPDLVVISIGDNGGGFEWARVCRKAEIPYAILVHCNSDLWWFREELGEVLASYRGARRVFCVSRRNLDQLRFQLGDPLLNAEIVRNPYNVPTAAAPPWPDASAGFRLACVARLELAAKGQDLLLRAFAEPKWRRRSVELNLYGAGPDEPALRHICGTLQLNNVHFRGHVRAVTEIWERNHLLVLPSRYEGLPLALVESMWCGRPAVVTDAGGNAELCIDSETGFVAPDATVSSLGEALERAWDRRTEWHSLGRAARARVEAEVPKDPVAVFCERLKAECLGHAMTPSYSA